MAKKAAAKNRMIASDGNLVRVRALVNLNEEGHRAPDDEFDVTVERARALGAAHIKPLSPLPDVESDDEEKDEGASAGDEGAQQ